MKRKSPQKKASRPVVRKSKKNFFHLFVISSVVSLVLVGIITVATYLNGSKNPNAHADVAPIHAVSVHYNNVQDQNEVNAMVTNVKNSHANTVSLEAGRGEWTYFKWQGHESDWSGDVQDTSTDLLARDIALYSPFAKVSALVDVFSPNYIKNNPQKAAISASGTPSENLVSTTELAQGEWGNHLVQMIDYIAANYPVESISITELDYHVDGYGPDDKTSYMAYSNKSDWPRNSDGSIAIDDPSVGKWRSYEVGLFVQKAAQAAHAHGKQLYMDVQVDWNNIASESVGHGQDYATMLKYADKIVIWDYFEMDGIPAQRTVELATYLKQHYNPEQIIISVGLWGTGTNIMSSDTMKQGIDAALSGGINNIWITPGQFMTSSHWLVLSQLWADAVTATPSPTAAVPTPTTIKMPTPTVVLPTSKPSPTVISRDIQVPNVKIITPNDGARVDRNNTKIIKANASDNVGVRNVKFFVNGSLLCNDMTMPYSCAWPVPGKRDVRYIIQAKAFDATGNSATNSIQVKSSRN